MSPPVLGDERWVRYLVAELSPEEQEACEAEYFAADDLFEEVQAVEHELIVAYCRGSLAGARRERFEARYLSSPERRERVEFVRALLGLSRRTSAPRRRPAWLPLAAGLAAALAAGVLAAQLVRTRSELRTVRARGEALERRAAEGEERAAAEGRRADGLAGELAEARAERRRLLESLAGPRSALRVAQFVLAAGLLRDAPAPNRFTLPGGTELVRLRMPLEKGDHAGYRGTVQTAEGREVWSEGPLGRNAAPSGPGVTLSVPAGRLPPGHYVAILAGTRRDGGADVLAEFVFQIVARRD